MYSIRTSLAAPCVRLESSRGAPQMLHAAENVINTNEIDVVTVRAFGERSFLAAWPNRRRLEG